LTIPSGATGITVTQPDGVTVELVPGTGLATTVTFAGTAQPGIYTVTPQRPPSATTAPSASNPGASPLATATAGTSPSGAISSASPAPPVDPDAPVRFAVDLFDVDESTIAPGAAATIERLGTGPAPSSGAGAGVATPRPSARDELWIPIVLIVLLALSIEWAVYHRDAVIRIRRGFATRLGRDAAGGST
jgi:hypothetical protein